MNMMNRIKNIIVKQDNIHNVLGRGLVFVLDDYYRDDFSIDEKIILNDILYKIIGIESASLGSYRLKRVGLLVKKCE